MVYTNCHDLHYTVRALRQPRLLRSKEKKEKKKLGKEAEARVSVPSKGDVQTVA
jgi:hypothetical protein